jgi:hypothetical protein
MRLCSTCTTPRQEIHPVHGKGLGHRELAQGTSDSRPTFSYESTSPYLEEHAYASNELEIAPVMYEFRGGVLEKESAV